MDLEVRQLIVSHDTEARESSQHDSSLWLWFEDRQLIVSGDTEAADGMIIKNMSHHYDFDPGNRQLIVSHDTEAEEGAWP